MYRNRLFGKIFLCLNIYKNGINNNVKNKLTLSKYVFSSPKHINNTKILFPPHTLAIANQLCTPRHQAMMWPSCRFSTCFIDGNCCVYIQIISICCDVAFNVGLAFIIFEHLYTEKIVRHVTPKYFVKKKFVSHHFAHGAQIIGIYDCRT